MTTLGKHLTKDDDAVEKLLLLTTILLHDNLLDWMANASSPQLPIDAVC